MKRFTSYIWFANLRWWYWWNFKATEREKCEWDMFTLGNAIMKHGKRIDPNVFADHQEA